MCLAQIYPLHENALTEQKTPLQVNINYWILIIDKPTIIFKINGIIINLYIINIRLVKTIQHNIKWICICIPTYYNLK